MPLLMASSAFEFSSTVSAAPFPYQARLENGAIETTHACDREYMRDDIRVAGDESLVHERVESRRSVLAFQRHLGRLMRSVYTDHRHVDGCHTASAAMSSSHSTSTQATGGVRKQQSYTSTSSLKFLQTGCSS